MNTAQYFANVLRLILLLTFVILFVDPVFAGGSWDPVHVKTLTLLSDTDYLLVVSPLPVDNSSFKGCERFEVHGTFARLEGVSWLFSWFYKAAPKKGSHLAALKYLRSFEGSAKTVNFGSMGYGFHPLKPSTPCIVESRGLQLLVTDGAVVSYYHEI